MFNLTKWSKKKRKRQIETKRRKQLMATKSIKCQILRHLIIPNSEGIIFQQDCVCISFFLFLLLGPHLQYMEVPRLGVQRELQLPAYTTATATSDLSHLACDLYQNSQQRQILNTLSEARDRTRNLMVPSQIHFCCPMAGTPHMYF